MLTGKAKQLFEEWMQSLPYKFQSDITGVLFNEITFNSLPLSMQWGVYQQWADSMGYAVGISFTRQNSVLDGYEDFLSPYIRRWNDKDEFAKDVFTYQLFRTRQEAQRAAIEKLNKIINER